tara:strand:- start:5974 stop:7266 length:1293 start_codon:yes stop_codon:yes gene_type:complete
MRYKFLIIIVINFLFSQALFNRFIGDDSFNGSVRSTSMGSNHLLASDLSSAIRYNPFHISKLNQGISIALQSNNSNIFERRTNIFKDSFGDFLTEGDYVWNQNYYSHYDWTIAYSLPLDEQGIGIGISYYSLTNFDYDYEEEVRDKYSADDGEQAIRDPNAGFHVLSSDGHPYVIALGLGWNYSDLNYSIGLGYSMNKINSFEMKEMVHVDTMYADVGNLSSVPSYSSSTTINPENGLFTSTVIQLNYKNRISLAIGVESKKRINSLSHNYETYSENNMYKYFTSVDDSIYYNVSGINYVKPGRLSLEFMHISPHNNPISIIFGYNKLDYDEIDISQFKFGFEYITQNNIPIRAGVLYSDSPIQMLSPRTKFSIGSGFSYNQLEVSYGSTFSLYNYDYPDLFPVEGDVRNYYDSVYESRFDLLLSLIYNF